MSREILEALHRLARARVPDFPFGEMNQRIIDKKWMLVWSYYFESLVDDDHGVSFGIGTASQPYRPYVSTLVLAATSTKRSENWTIVYGKKAKNLDDFAALKKRFPEGRTDRETAFALFNRLLTLTLGVKKPKHRPRRQRKEK